jgi:hypothetical protein
MKRWRAILAVWLAAAAALLSAAELPDFWRSWHYSRAVSPNASPSDGPAQILLPWEVVAHCKTGCADLRLIDARGQEVPYELRVARGTTDSRSYQAGIVENSFVAGRYTQLVGDLGLPPPAYDLVRVETAERDFMVWAEVALSDDAKTWRVVEPRAPIARFGKRLAGGTESIPFAGLSSRYIRVRIFEADHPFPVTGLAVAHALTKPPEHSEVPATFEPAKAPPQAAGEKESVWESDRAASYIPVSQLRFATDSAEFYRAVRLSSSSDGKEWTYRGSGCIYRYRLGGTVRESLAVDFTEWPEIAGLRVEVLNGDDAPLRNVKLSVFAMPRRMLLKPQAGAAYRLIYGNERALAPHYDLGRYLEAGPDAAAYPALMLGPEETTTNYRDPRPFTERHPELLWVSLGIAVFLIGLTALKTLRTPADASPTSGAS